MPLKAVRQLVVVGLLAAFPLFTSPASSCPAPGTDSHPCYDPDDPFTWCNIDLPCQRFVQVLAHDRLFNAVVTLNGINYYVNIWVRDVWINLGGQWVRRPECNATSATPAALYNTWTCSSNIGDPWFQNWDSCAGRALKMMLYCYLTPGNVEVTSADGQRSQAVAYELNIYLDTLTNCICPASNPNLNPPPAANHLYAKRHPLAGQGCPNYKQPYGCP